MQGDKANRRTDHWHLQEHEPGAMGADFRPNKKGCQKAREDGIIRLVSAPAAGSGGRSSHPIPTVKFNDPD